MITTEEKIEIINKAINSTKENLKPLSINFIFWGVFIIIMSLVHYIFFEFIEAKKYFPILFWTVLPFLAMVYTIYYNVKAKQETGYVTYLDRVVKIIWTVFNVGWLVIITVSLVNGLNPVPDILFVLSLMLMITGLIIRFHMVTLGGVFLMTFTVFINFYPDINLFLVNIVGVTFGMLLPGLALYKSKLNEGKN